MPCLDPTLTTAPGPGLASSSDRKARVPPDRSPKVHLDRVAPSVHVGVEAPAGSRDGVIDQQVHPAERFRGRRPEALDLIGDGHVGGDLQDGVTAGRGDSASRLDRGVEVLARQIGNHHRHAHSGQPNRQGPADAESRTGNHGDAPRAKNVFAAHSCLRSSCRLIVSPLVRERCPSAGGRPCRSDIRAPGMARQTSVAVIVHFSAAERRREQPARMPRPRRGSLTRASLRA